MVWDKISVANVDFKDLKFGFSPRNNSRSGILYFGEEKIATFDYSGKTKYLMDEEVHNEDLAKECVDFTKLKNYDEEDQTLKSFIESAVTVYTLKNVISLEQMKAYLDAKAYNRPDGGIYFEKFEKDCKKAIKYEYSCSDSHVDLNFRTAINRCPNFSAYTLLEKLTEVMELNKMLERYK